MIEAPRDTAGMTEKDDTVYKDRHAASGSIASKTDNQILSEANSARMGQDDPLARLGVQQEENIPGFQPGPGFAKGRTLSTEVDPVYGKSGLVIGDRIYHKLKKSEGVVKDMLASGGIIVKLDNGIKGKTSAENLVKL